MINNNHVVKITAIEYYITNSVHCKHNKYFSEGTLSVEYLLKFRYEDGFASYIPFKANKSFIDNFLRSRYD